MFEALLVVIGGGVLLAAAVPRVSDVRPTWLRLAGAIALAGSGWGAALAALRTGLVPTPPFYRRTQAALVGMTVASAVAHVAVTRWRRSMPAARGIGVVGFLLAVLAGSNLLHDAMLTRGTAVMFPPKAFSIALQTLSTAGAGAVVGLAVMTALFPAFGIPAAADSGGAVARAFLRLHRSLLAVLAIRAAASVGAAFLLSPAPSAPIPDGSGPSIVVRWVVGIGAVVALAIAARRRMAAGVPLSAAAFLLLGALCAADGEAVALALVRETGLPF